MHRPQTPVGAKVKAAEALLHCTDHLLAIYDAMPLVNTMSDYINGKYGVGPDPPDEPTSSE